MRDRTGHPGLIAAAVLAALGAIGEAQTSWMRHIVVERDRPVKMRDGVTLSADVYRPDAPGRFPALLMRTPYNKEGALQSGRLAFTVAAVRRGYVVVVQDTRGQFKSEGRFIPYVQEVHDGYDTIEWAARLPWVDGQVGTFGLSYPGAVQWMTAPTRPPSLKAMSPAMTFAHHNHFVYHGGVFESAFLNWMLGRQIRDRIRLGLPLTSSEEIAREWNERGETWMAFRPLRELPLMRDFPYWSEWLDNPIESAYWQPFDIEAQHARVAVPVLNLTGWNDDNYGQPGAIRNFTGMRKHGATEAARAGQRLIVGPWTHGVPTISRTTYAGVDYGPNAAIDFTEPQLRFFDYWLRGIDDGYSSEPPVRIFVMGENRWREEDDWPPARTDYEEWFLGNDGRLSRAAGVPADSEFVYDPRDPARVPEADGQAWQQVTSRPDVLAFTSAPLERETEITGHIVARLWIASTAPDTDITARLLVLDADGVAQTITAAPGVLRARYRSTERPQPPAPLKPGEPAELEISLGYTSILLPAGTRLQVIVTGSMMQGLDIHPNTWEPSTSAGQAVPATQTLYHGGRHRSRIILPIIPR